MKKRSPKTKKPVAKKRAKAAKKLVRRTHAKLGSRGGAAGAGGKFGDYDDGRTVATFDRCPKHHTWFPAGGSCPKCR